MAKPIEKVLRSSYNRRSRKASGETRWRNQIKTLYDTIKEKYALDVIIVCDKESKLMAADTAKGFMDSADADPAYENYLKSFVVTGKVVRYHPAEGSQPIDTQIVTIWVKEKE